MAVYVLILWEAMPAAEIFLKGIVGQAVGQTPQATTAEVRIQAARAQYILLNAFSEQKIGTIEDTGKILYRFGMTHGKNKKNFEVFTAEEFIAAITRHIPEKYFQMVRYYGWYSSRSRAEGTKAGLFMPGDEPAETERPTWFNWLAHHHQIPCSYLNRLCKMLSLALSLKPVPVFQALFCVRVKSELHGPGFIHFGVAFRCACWERANI